MTQKIDEQINPAWLFTRDHIERYAYWKNAFTSEECDTIIDSIKSKYTLYDAKVTNYQNLSHDDLDVNKDFRDSKIVFINPEDDFRWIYARLTDIVQRLNYDFFKFDLTGFLEGLQFCEYNAPTGNFGIHVDRNTGSYAIRKLSIVLQLTDENSYEGGNFEFVDGKEREVLPRAKGTLFAFPSWTLHEVMPVTKGTRHSLVGWVSGPPFR